MGINEHYSKDLPEATILQPLASKYSKSISLETDSQGFVISFS
jgi:hypothetical protein